MLFFLVTLITYIETDIENRTNEISLKYDDQRAEFRIFMDIENEYNRVNININDCANFERIHKIIYLKKYEKTMILLGNIYNFR